jgi:predicted permease
VLEQIKYAVRQFRLAPAFTVAAVLTLALGIGGTTAIFTLIDAVMLKSLPVKDPSRLYRIGTGDNCCVQGGPQEEWGFFSYPLFQTLASQAPEFEEITAFRAGLLRLSVRHGEEAARPLRMEYATGNYFSTLGISAFAGRVFTPADDLPSSSPVAVMSHHTWQDTYGSDPSIVGGTMDIEGHPFTIVGVAPPGFFGDTLRADPPEIWVPLQQEPLIAGDGSLLRQPISAWLRAIGRLKPDASTTGMAPRLTGVLHHWMQYDAGYPSNWMPDIVRTLPKQTLNVIPAGSGVGELKQEYDQSLKILLAVCALVLLIACANVANLMLARGVARRTQTALRLAIGAPRREIVAQALVEAVLLAIAGGVAGLLIATAAAKLLLGLAFRSAHFTPIATTPSLLVLGFAFALALVTGVLFGAAPAWFATRTDPIDALRGSGRSTGDHSSFTRKALVVVQATLSVVLVAGSIMLARSLSNLQNQDFGYRVDNRIVVSLHNPLTGYSTPRLIALYRAIEERLRQIPGVQGAGLALYNPLSDNWGELVLVQGHPMPKGDENAGASWDRVSASFLQDFGISVLRGRGFTAGDDERSELVAVVNQAFVKRFFKSGEDPLGQHFGLDEPQNVGTFRIVGVVRDAKFAGWGLSRPARPMFYVPLAQDVPYPKTSVMARVERQSHFIGGLMLTTSQAPGALEPQLTRALGAVEPNLTIVSVKTMREQVESRFDQERAVASLAGLFGVVALVLAAVGLYGVTAYSVAQRTNEIGIRMALGADRTRVIDLVLRSAFARVAIGLVAGVPLAIAAGRLISTELYGVTFWDPFALSAAAIALGISAFCAAMIPALRAAGLSPIKALRTE